MKTILTTLLLLTTATAHARSAPMQTARDRNLDRLYTYAMAGDFPRNVDDAGRAMYFLDDEGRPCAVAFLMQQSGYGKAVAQIARTNNAIKVSPKTRGPIADWIQTSGFSVQDVMRIQEPLGYIYSADDPVALQADRDRIQQRLLAVIADLRES